MPQVTVDDGVQIAYWLDDFTDPWEEERDIILMHHGSAEHSKFFNPIVPELARKYQVLRFDSRGRGESSAPPKGFTLSGGPDDVSGLAERLVKDIINLLDYLGIPRVHFFGVSSGGVVGALFAAAHPDRVKSLVLCTTPYMFPRELLPTMSQGEKDVTTAIEKLGTEEWWNRVFGPCGVLDISKARTKLAKWELAERQKIPTHVYASFWKLVQAFDISSVLSKIKAPTLILAAEKSTIATLEQQSYMEQQIPNAKLIVFEGIGHSIHMLRPERTAEAVLDFIKTID